MPELIRLSEEVFLLHPFDERLGVWQRVEIGGSVLPFDMTFNHQLWFAAAGGLLAGRGCTSIDAQVRRFLDRLPELLKTFPSGLIWHPLVLEDGPWNRAMGFFRRRASR